MAYPQRPEMTRGKGHEEYGIRRAGAGRGYNRPLAKRSAPRPGNAESSGHRA